MMCQNFSFKDTSDKVKMTAKAIMSHLFPDEYYEWESALDAIRFNLVPSNGTINVEQDTSNQTFLQLEEPLIADVNLVLYEEDKILYFRPYLTLDDPLGWSGTLTVEGEDISLKKNSKNYNKLDSNRKDWAVSLSHYTGSKLKANVAFKADNIKANMYGELLADQAANALARIQNQNERFIVDLVSSIPMYSKDGSIINIFANEHAKTTKELYNGTNAATVIPAFRRWKANLARANSV